MLKETMPPKFLSKSYLTTESLATAAVLDEGIARGRGIFDITTDIVDRSTEDGPGSRRENRSGVRYSSYRRTPKDQ